MVMIIVQRACYYIYLNRYPNKESFVADAQLIFANCEYYNEDDSEVIRNVFVFTLNMYFNYRLVN